MQIKTKHLTCFLELKDLLKRQDIQMMAETHKTVCVLYVTLKSRI